MKILDVCCGGKRFYYDKENPSVTFMDIRQENFEIHGKKIDVNPDVIGDFRSMPFDDETFDLIVFDPPHLKWAGNTSIMKAQYGQLDLFTWADDIHKGMSECMRVAKSTATIIFKWNEAQVSLKEVLEALSPYKPLFGNKINKKGTTHWLTFVKERSG